MAAWQMLQARISPLKRLCGSLKVPLKAPITAFWRSELAAQVRSHPPGAQDGAWSRV